MLFTAKIRLFYLYYIKVFEPTVFSKKAEKSASTGASGATGAKRTVKAAHKKLPAKGPRPSAGSKIHFKP